MHAKLSSLLRLAPAALLTVTGGPATATADDFFLKIDGIPGESLDAKHKDEIQIESFQWGVSNPASAVGGGGGAAPRPSFQDFGITARLNKASPKLFLACARGEPLKTALLTVRRPGKEQQEYYTIKMEDVRVSYVQNGAQSTTAGVGETIAFNFSKITWSYAPQKIDGSLDTKVTTSWDIKLNEGG